MTYIKKKKITEKERSRLKSKIIAALRKLSLGWRHRVLAKNKVKIDKALFQCQSCRVMCYEGTNEKRFAQYKETYDNVIRDKVHMDHIDSVISVTDGWKDFNTYIERLFCHMDNFQALCPLCHNKKSQTENENR